MSKITKIRSAPTVKLNKPKNKPTAKAYLQVFGTGGGDTSPSVFLFADSQRYVFSCGEATQRLFHENKLKIGKINNVFLTQLSWKFIGGLPGLLLTLREACKQSLNVHGPCGLSDFITASQCFMWMNNVNLTYFEYGSKQADIYKDENIIMKAIPIEGEDDKNFSYNSQIIEISHSKDYSLNTRDHASESNLYCKKSKTQPCTAASESAKRCKLDVKPRTVVSYVCKLVAMPGKMNIKKALELGVPKGPLLGKLQKGQNVTLENGFVVKAEDIVEKSLGGCVFCIIDCPSQYYFKQLQNNQDLASYEEGGAEETPTIIIHLSPAQLVQTPEYKTWTERFGDSCQHLFMNSEMCAPKVAMFSQLGIQYSLNELNPDIFPKLFASDTPETEPERSQTNNWTAGEPYLIYHLRPTTQRGYDRTDILTKWQALAEKVAERLRCLKPGIAVSEIKDSLTDFICPEKFLCEKVDKRSLKNSLGSDLNSLDEDFGIVFLGTGASLPSKYRNVSCTLVNISKDKLMLLDCGEGTYGQLYRHYGPNLDEILRKLCCIFISHIHADHHLGLVRVIQAWEKSTSCLAAGEMPEPILIIGPSSLFEWLSYYGNFCEELNLRFFNSCNFQAEFTSEIISSLLESKVEIVPVIHCPKAFGLVMTHKKGWKLVYSGDTRPCRALIEKGINATVLIHEATLEDNLVHEALAKQHSTTSEAIQCGQEMQAKFTLLNHFSQRYPKVPVFSEEFNDCVGIAFDHMKVGFQDLSSLPKLLCPLQEIFKEEIEEQKIRMESNVEIAAETSLEESSKPLEKK